MKNIIGIDVGGSTTKIVGFRKDSKVRTLIPPQFVRADDPITSVYGAFGKFTLDNKLSLEDIDTVLMTGVGSSYITKPIYSLPCKAVSEFDCIGLGGLYLSGLDEAVVVSMGTGTALIYAKRDADKTQIEYLGGTGMGGGTLLGLSRKILGVDTVEHIEKLCEDGNLDNIDLRISDISNPRLFPEVSKNLTAANFGKLSDLATPGDIALGLANMVGETVFMLSVFAARRYNIKNIVLTGNLSVISPVRRVFETLQNSFGVNFIIPEYAQFSTVIGAALQDQ